MKSIINKIESQEELSPSDLDKLFEYAVENKRVGHSGCLICLIDERYFCVCYEDLCDKIVLKEKPYEVFPHKRIELVEKIEYTKDKSNDYDEKSFDNVSCNIESVTDTFCDWAIMTPNLCNKAKLIATNNLIALVHISEEENKND